MSLQFLVVFLRSKINISYFYCPVTLNNWPPYINCIISFWNSIGLYIPQPFLPELTMTHSSTDCFVNKTFIETQPQLATYALSMAAFVLQWLSWIVATEPLVFAKPKFDPSLWLLYIIFYTLQTLQNNAIMFALISFACNI